MNRRSDFLKLRELRSKTDRQLLALIRHELDAARELARSFDDPSQLLAMAAHDEACRLLPLVYSLSYNERCRLESELDEVANLLNAAA